MEFKIAPTRSSSAQSRGDRLSNNRRPSESEQTNIIATDVASQNYLSVLPSVILVSIQFVRMSHRFQQVTAKWTCLMWAFCNQPLNSIQSASTHISLNLLFSTHLLINFSQHPNHEPCSSHVPTHVRFSSVMLYLSIILRLRN